MLAGPEVGPTATAALAARIASGAVFAVFGVGKFVNHGAEVDSFRTYGLPSPDGFVYAIGVIELVGGVLLVAGLGTRLVALVLAGDTIGAIVVSGIAKGEIVSLTLAPMLLALMVFLIAVGSGRAALDRRLGLRIANPPRAAPGS
jgi:putative oxidoreductase